MAVKIGEIVADKEMVSLYNVPKKKHKPKKTQHAIKRGSSKPEIFWDKSDFNDVFEIDQRLWVPIFYRTLGK